MYACQHLKSSVVITAWQAGISSLSIGGGCGLDLFMESEAAPQHLVVRGHAVPILWRLSQAGLEILQSIIGSCNFLLTCTLNFMQAQPAHLHALQCHQHGPLNNL